MPLSMQSLLLYVYTTHLRRTKIMAQKTFTFTHKAVDPSFEGYGFTVHVPKGSLPTELSETQHKVGVNLSGQFQLPSKCELVSAVYWVSSPHKFTKPLVAEIQHCAILSSDKQCEQLTFVRTKCTLKELKSRWEESSRVHMVVYHFPTFLGFSI